MSLKESMAEPFQKVVEQRYIPLFADPKPRDELRSTIDELVAGDHITYCTSWGTLLGRTALKEYAETIQAAFPSLSFRIETIASCDGVVYCQWAMDDVHRVQHRNGSGPEPVLDRKTMTISTRDELITETWRPCDPWLPLWSDAAATPPNRGGQKP